MKTIGVEHLDDLALGSVFLATGGGGDPYVPKLITAEALKTYGPVKLLSHLNVDDDAFIVPVGSVGAPTVSLELLPSVEDAARTCLLYTSPSPRDQRGSRMPSSA